MAYFARLDDTNTVIEKLCVHDDDTKDVNGNISEEVGIKFCQSLFGENTRWIMCSGSTTEENEIIRGIPGDIGFTYDEVKDVFMKPKPYPSWNVYDYETNEWISPQPKPENGENYIWIWDENNICWKVVYGN